MGKTLDDIYRLYNLKQIYAFVMQIRALRVIFLIWVLPLLGPTGSGGVLRILSHLCDLYGEIDGLRMACRKEKSIIDRRINWLHQMNFLVDQLEKTCEEIQYTIDAQPPMPVPHEIQERSEKLKTHNTHNNIIS